MLRNCESSRAREELVMRKDISESTDVDLEDKRWAKARRTSTTDPLNNGDRRRLEKEAGHRPSRRPRWSLAGERSS